MSSGSASRRRARFIALLLCIGGCAAACQKSAPPPSTTAAGAPARIVSLSPAISRTIVALQAEGAVVGRTPFCASLDQTIPVAGDIEGADYERLLRLRPTHLLVQPPLRGVDPELQRLASEQGWVLRHWHLDSIAEVRALVDELPGVIAPDDTALRARADALVLELDACIAPTAREAGWAGPTLLLSHVDPPMAFGRGTYLDELLTSLGSENAIAARGWASMTLEDIVRLDPAAIIVVRPGEQTGLMDEITAPLDAMDIGAVRDGRVAWLGHEDAFLPSAGVIGVASDLRAVLDVMGRQP